ncbi:superfamily II DNA/RNA helicase [Catenovulum agarivorans DS-2]|uniref:Superfamily II DNA/RNA helicase n=1 Tax=Catenovulum agarivorans DS-2 TaxID=1328313 RepID=W7QZG8_9ALTE|nr:hypothetical protein [Catenovulum agarivorans]EWH10760.1 superfamily II DNA/RNA helicase [Catenovulum agarivorans DS-2]
MLHERNNILAKQEVELAKHFNQNVSPEAKVDLFHILKVEMTFTRFVGSHKTAVVDTHQRVGMNGSLNSVISLELVARNAQINNSSIMMVRPYLIT